MNSGTFIGFQQPVISFMKSMIVDTDGIRIKKQHNNEPKHIDSWNADTRHKYMHIIRPRSVALLSGTGSSGGACPNGTELFGAVFL